MEVKPIFVCYLPVNQLDSSQIYEYISQVRDHISYEIKDWSVLIVPTREDTLPRFESFSANNLTELQQSHLDKLQEDLKLFLDKPENEG